MKGTRWFRRIGLPLVVFVVVAAAGQAAVGLRASRTSPITGDEPFYLVTTQSLLSDGDLDLRDEYADADMEMRRFWRGTKPLWKQMEPAADGRLLSPHDPGLSLLVLPAYWVGGVDMVQRFLVLLWAAAMAVTAVVAVRRFSVPPAASGLAAIAVGAGTPGVVYASEVYPEGPAALAVAVGLAIALADRARPVALASVSVALCWLGIKYAPYAAVLAAVWMWRFRRERAALVTFALLSLAAAGHSAWWHLRTFDGLTPYSTNVVWAGEGTASIVTDHLGRGDRSYRLYGLFIDERFGLFRWSPIALLGVIGIVRRTLLPVALVGVGVLMGTFVSITMMGWWFPGRLLVAALPALVVLVAVAVTRLPKTALLLTVWSLAITARLVVSDVLIAIDPWTIGLPLPPADLFPDFRSFGVKQVGISLGWLVAVVSIASLVRWRSSSSSTATPSPTGRSSPSPPTWRPLRVR